MTRSRSRIGKAWTEAMPAAIARGANDGQRSAASGEVRDDDRRAGAVAVEAGALVVLDLEQLEQPRVLAGGADVVERAVATGQHHPGGTASGDVGGMGRDGVEELDEVEVGHEGVGHLDEDGCQSLDLYAHVVFIPYRRWRFYAQPPRPLCRSGRLTVSYPVRPRAVRGRR